MSKKEKLLIIGGLGYIGSFLADNLPYDIEIVDLNLFNYQSKHKTHIIDYKVLPPSFFKKFNHVILLAGHSSVRMCEGTPSGVFYNNVTNFVNLLDKLLPSQTFIYASSASVYGNSEKHMVDEKEPLSAPYNMYDLTKQIIDTYVKTNKKQSKIFGLRFGTVNGYSPHLRNDVMLNSMVYNAKHKNEILLYNQDTKRAILGINDLKNAIQVLIQSKTTESKIYNLASFTKTAGEMAQITGDLLNVHVKHVVPEQQNAVNINEKLVSSKYNFGLNCSSFMNDFNFTFKDTIDTIVSNLATHWNTMYISNRNGAYNYENK